MTMRDVMSDVLVEALESDERTAVVIADIGLGRLGSTASHPRVFNVGIREPFMIGFGAGLALAGLRPVIHSYAPFLVERPFEQIKLDLSHQDVGAVLVSIGASYDTAGEGRTHQAPADVALMATLPDWQIHVPGHPDEAESILRSAIAGEGRHYVRLSTGENGSAHAAGTTLVQRAPQARGTVVAVGPMLDPVLEATESLAVDVLYTTSVRPFPDNALREALTAPTVILVEPYQAGTSAATVAAALTDIPHRLLSLGVVEPELRRYGATADHARAHGLDTVGLATSIGAFLDR